MAAVCCVTTHHNIHGTSVKIKSELHNPTITRGSELAVLVKLIFTCIIEICQQYPNEFNYTRQIRDTRQQISLKCTELEDAIGRTRVDKMSHCIAVVNAQLHRPAQIQKLCWTENGFHLALARLNDLRIALEIEMTGTSTNNNNNDISSFLTLSPHDATGEDFETLLDSFAFGDDDDYTISNPNTNAGTENFGKNPNQYLEPGTRMWNRVCQLVQQLQNETGEVLSLNEFRHIVMNKQNWDAIECEI